VSRAGVFPLSGSLDNVGPLTRSVADAAAMLGAIAGHDPLDPVTSTRPVPDYLATIDEGVAGVRIGVDEDFISNEVRSDVTAAVQKAAGVLEELGAELVAVRMPDSGPQWRRLCASTCGARCGFGAVDGPF